MFGSEDLQTLVDRIWFEMLGMHAHPKADAKVGDPAMESKVEIQGGWNGAVSVTVEDELVRSCAAVMFDLKLENVTAQDKNDVMLELINMLGGNVKAMVAEDSQLTLPGLCPPGSGVASPTVEERFECDGRAFQVAILER